jgi:hypothetical protein
MRGRLGVVHGCKVRRELNHLVGCDRDRFPKGAEAVGAHLDHDWARVDAPIRLRKRPDHQAVEHELSARLAAPYDERTEVVADDIQGPPQRHAVRVHPCVLPSQRGHEVRLRLDPAPERLFGQRDLGEGVR